MSAELRVGIQVVCIDDDFGPHAARCIPRVPKRGEVFTIRGIHNCYMTGVLGLLFEEIYAPMGPNSLFEWLHPASHFRPVRKTDISIFTAMLNPTELVQ